MPDEEKLESLSEVLERWWKRFQFALGFWKEPPQDHFREHYESFNDLVVVLVTASFIEGLLYLGVQFAGFDVKGGRKTITLGSLITEALKRGVIDEPLAILLYGLNDMRNHTAHEADYRLTGPEIGKLYEQLPKKEKDALQPAFANILPEPGADVVVRLTIERIAAMTYEAVANMHRHWRDARSDAQSESGGEELL